MDDPNAPMDSLNDTDDLQTDDLKSTQHPANNVNRWMFVVQALNQPGTLTAAAAVFSNRGVSLEGILGSGIDTNTIEDGRLLFSFRATPQKQALLKRSLQRLPSILKVKAYTYEDARLRAIAIVKVNPDSQLSRDSEQLHVETIRQTDSYRLSLLTGATAVVEAKVAQLRSQSQLVDVVISAITV
ncbi:MAG: acetolactate synthase small subunit [Cyanobacteria bacterium J06626_6]